VTVLTPVTDAIVLAAGNGDRFSDPQHRSKLLVPVGGVPLIVRTLRAAWAAGIRCAHVVLGYRAAEVHQAIVSEAPERLALSFIVNPRWQLENGISVLSARRALKGRRFALLMGDHVFDPTVLRRMRVAPLTAGVSLLAVDRHITDRRIVMEATKVRTDAGRIVAIGKDLETFDAIDTGLFVCSDNLFDALDAACRTGDTTLSGGIRRLSALGLVHTSDIGDARWHDIDTADDLARVEAWWSTATARPA
jgi:1L-myo-inositol 1-phosphate cytidylyltransferase